MLLGTPAPHDEVACALGEADLPASLEDVTDDAARARLDGILEHGRVQGEIAPGAGEQGFEPAEIQAETLLLYGYADTLVGPAHARWWKDNVLDARIEMMPKVGHPLVAIAGWKRVLSHLAPGRGSAGTKS